MITTRGANLMYLDHGREIFACKDIDLEVRDGEFLGILGPSGSGKSSLLYLLSGLKGPTSGDVLLEGQSYAEMSEEVRSGRRLREFGFVFQQPFLIGYLSALENVHMACRAGEAEELLGRLGLAEKAHRMPAELSGGEKQRVCIARALFPKPKVVFADEPTASLDHATGEQVMRLLAEHRSGALVVVTHDPSMLHSADRIIAIEEGRATELSQQERADLGDGHPSLLH